MASDTASAQSSMVAGSKRPRSATLDDRIAQLEAELAVSLSSDSDSDLPDSPSRTSLDESLRIPSLPSSALPSTSFISNKTRPEKKRKKNKKKVKPSPSPEDSKLGGLEETIKNLTYTPRSEHRAPFFCRPCNLQLSQGTWDTHQSSVMHCEIVRALKEKWSCRVCKVGFNGETQWEEHMGSKKHKERVRMGGRGGGGRGGRSLGGRGGRGRGVGSGRGGRGPEDRRQFF